MNEDHLIPDPPVSASMLELAPGVRVPGNSLRLQYARGGGPGGQNVNKLNSKAELWVTLSAILGLTESARHRLATSAGSRLTQAGEIHLSSDTHRTQSANRAEVLERLRELIVQARHEPKKRRKTRPSKAAKQRRLSAKKIRSEIKSNRRYNE